MRPRRGLVAVPELLAVILLAWLAWWCWHRGMIVTMYNGVALHRVEGRWWTAAAGAATLAGILVLDALQQGYTALFSAPPFPTSEALPPEQESRQR